MDYDKLSIDVLETMMFHDFELLQEEKEKDWQKLLLKEGGPDASEIKGHNRLWAGFEQGKRAEWFKIMKAAMDKKDQEIEAKKQARKFAEKVSALSYIEDEQERKNQKAKNDRELAKILGKPEKKEKEEASEKKPVEYSQEDLEIIRYIEYESSPERVRERLLNKASQTKEDVTKLDEKERRLRHLEESLEDIFSRRQKRGLTK